MNESTSKYTPFELSMNTFLVNTGFISPVMRTASSSHPMMRFLVITGLSLVSFHGMSSFFISIPFICVFSIVLFITYAFFTFIPRTAPSMRLFLTVPLSMVMAAPCLMFRNVLSMTVPSSMFKANITPSKRQFVMTPSDCIVYFLLW